MAAALAAASRATKRRPGCPLVRLARAVARYDVHRFSRASASRFSATHCARLARTACHTLTVVPAMSSKVKPATAASRIRLRWENLARR